jgi:hypothetical protein
MKYVWSEACGEAFHTLKRLFTTSPVLAHPDIAKSFDVYCDACSTGLGCVHMQEGRVIAYYSWQLRHHEEHYPIHDLELVTFVLALMIWWHYLLGNVAHIYIDHMSLKYIFTQLDLNMRQWRLLELIKDHELEVHYHPGKTNVVVDMLSHKAHWFVTAQHHTHTPIEGRDHWHAKEWWRYGTTEEKIVRRWTKGQLLSWGFGRNLMIQGLDCCAKERSTQEEDYGRSPYVEVLHSSW